MPLINNPKDPLLGTGPDYQRILLEKFAKEAGGFSTDAVIGAAINLLINAIRQSYSNRNAAETRWNDLVGRSKATLLEHYDSVSGKRRPTFAHTQIVHAAHVSDSDIIKP